MYHKQTEFPGNTQGIKLSYQLLGGTDVR